MRSKRVLRHYCEHCPKSGCNSSAIRKHESQCFRNPTRVCPLCRDANIPQQPIATLIATYAKDGLAAVLELTQGCPACTIAAHVQEVLSRGESLSDPEEYMQYDYREGRNAFMDRHQHDSWP